MCVARIAKYVCNYHQRAVRRQWALCEQEDGERRTGNPTRTWIREMGNPTQIGTRQLGENS